MLKHISKKVLWAAVSIAAIIAIVFTIFYLVPDDPAGTLLGKPVIYLYPEHETDVEVKLELDGRLDFTYPAYGSGWRVTASPDGRLIDSADGREYSYLFWEGVSSAAFDMTSGFIVARGDLVEFFQEKLAFLGLVPKEYNDFITYWVPKMQSAPYSLIAFQDEAYTDVAKLEVSPTPDSVLRVFMAFELLGEPIDIAEQALEPFERTGFSVIEWGGAEV